MKVAFVGNPSVRFLLNFGIECRNSGVRIDLIVLQVPRPIPSLSLLFVDPIRSGWRSVLGLSAILRALTVALFMHRHGPVVLTWNINHSPRARELLSRCSAERVLVRGGRVIHPDVLALAPVPWLNLHLGILPFYRGHDSNLWAISCGDWEHIGASLHFVESRVDAGAVISEALVPAEPGWSFRRLRTELSNSEKVLARDFLSQKVKSDKIAINPVRIAKHRGPFPKKFLPWQKLWSAVR